MIAPEKSLTGKGGMKGGFGEIIRYRAERAQSPLSGYPMSVQCYIHQNRFPIRFTLNKI